jgi:hypothetical protein
MAMVTIMVARSRRLKWVAFGSEGRSPLTLGVTVAHGEGVPVAERRSRSDDEWSAPWARRQIRRRVGSRRPQGR